MTDYQPFPISNFRGAFQEAVEPWLLPKDAYQVLQNAHLYRGVIEKINGYDLFAKFSYRILQVPTTGAIDGVNNIFVFDLANVPSTSDFFGIGARVFGSEVETFLYFDDASATVVNLDGNQGGSGTVNFSTMQATLIFNIPPPSGSFVLFEYDYYPTTQNAIMGIKPYYNKSGTQEIIVLNQNRAGTIQPNLGFIAAASMVNYGIEEIPHPYYQPAAFTSNGSTGPYTGTLTQHPFVSGTLVFQQYTSAGEIVTSTNNGLIVPDFVYDNGVGGLFGPNVSSGTINYTTGAYSVTFSSAPPSGNVFDGVVGIYGNFFTGSISNFFTISNYQY